MHTMYFIFFSLSLFFTFTFNWLRCIYCSCIKITVLFGLLLFVDCLPDEARADIADDENSTEHEDVDYDKIFDDNLLKQAYEYKKRRDSSAVENDVTDDEDGDEVSRVSSSQEIGNRVVTRNVKRPVSEKEELTDFDGEVVFRKELKSPSPKKSHLEDMEDSKKPMAKRTKRDLESLPDDENPSETDRKLREEAFFQYCHMLQSNLQVWV